MAGGRVADERKASDQSTRMADWIAERDIAEVECIVPDMNGVQRGKVLPAAKFLSRGPVPSPGRGR